MNLGAQKAAQIREVLISGKWIAHTNYNLLISDLNWKDAVYKIDSLNSIAALTFHINYYLNGLIHFFETGKLEIRDKYSFDLPPISSENEWQELRQRFLDNAERFASMVAQMPDEKFSADFLDAQYGNYLRNIDGTIEHAYYHMGQIVLIKKLIKNRKDA